MKLLKSCLWLCAAAVGLSPVRAQETLTPEQQKQAQEALRKTLERGAVQSTQEAEAQTRNEIRARAAAEEMRRRAEARAKAEEARIKAQTAAREKALKAKAEADASRLPAQAAPTASPAATVPSSSLAPTDDAAAREALRRTLEQRSAVPAPAPDAPVAPAPAPAPPVVVEPPTAPRPATSPEPAASSGLTPQSDAAAREALRQALQGSAPAVPAIKPGTPPPPAEIVPNPPAPKPEPRRETPPQAGLVVPQPAPAAPRLSGDAETAAREALRKAMEHPAPSPAPVPTAPPRTASSPQPSIPLQAPAPEAVATTAPQLTENAAAAAREALRKAMEQLPDAEDEAQTRREGGVRAEARPAATRNAAAVPPTQNGAPAAPAVKSKSQRLAELTELYRRDLISAADYHQQRAKILNEP